MVSLKPSAKKLKLSQGTIQTKTIPKITIKKGVLDEDEEAPIEEQFILRMPAGAAAEKLREAVKAREIPEDFSVVFQDPRRATFNLGQDKYSAKLVDLPCILESHKTFDSKQFFKIADISQMLVVEERMPDVLPPTPTQPLHHDEYTWPHGLTAPLWNVRKRRFRQRISKRTIEDVEKEVVRLLEADAEAEQVWFEVDDGTDRNIAEADEDEDDEDAEGSVDEEQGASASASNLDIDEEDDALAAAWEDTFGERADEVENAEEDEEDEEEEEEGSEDEEDEEEDESEGEGGNGECALGGQDDAERLRVQQQVASIVAEIADLEARIEDNRTKLAVQINPIMRKRFEDIVTRLSAQALGKKTELEDLQANLGI
ncbi:hypothetical protein PhCBS80983_g03641 [Powellomyces hirtus]|uniref:TAFII55 protein conserved region domain-containing protein n=1 Tax=Powellomyces hirtus TaxID=109895 RepID=A0A507E3I8_9FUNG|nr:hypothetical protein PhCBS80983_g03641 [Powellomyces hirtus]